MAGQYSFSQRTTLAAFCCLLSGGLFSAFSGGVRCAEATTTLVVHTPCLQSLHILSDHAQSEAARIDGKTPAAITLKTADNGATTLAQSRCTGADSLTVSVRPEISLTIDNAGTTNITMEDRTGPTFIHAGSGTLKLGKTGELGLFSDSSGPITISTLADSARIRSEQSAPITITSIAAPALALYLGGSASFTASSGHLKALEITSASTKDAVFHGVTDVGLFHVQQSGGISVDKVTGALATERDGSGKIISDAAAPPPRVRADKANVLP
ncbi:hypothetical protein AA0473_2032 [Acetobacter orleanensis NRIC 0473]|uniref:Auto-transporter adhesin head GIN domain-containing protein n=2 Tax=Acetobacter orleanensis TaxID=104099 RepID=A0A4Y3TSQ3_9PROT|nr:hypothetical protein Abol_013_029 [Acetobacter orleanensis JCM 7639]GBR29502.1 hypothetical protein AA0473_2032 [Acetobacter orleanensis NRIC 0473]GEB83785.1 hypothetical protein AOR01nite_22620 [Acetobacter orleanensis]